MYLEYDILKISICISFRISLLKLQVVFDHFINQNQENRSKIIKLKSKRNVAKPRRDILININSNSDIDDDIYSDNCDIASDCSADEIYNDILNADDLKENSSNCAEENVDNCIERMTQYKVSSSSYSDCMLLTFIFVNRCSCRCILTF